MPSTHDSRVTRTISFADLTELLRQIFVRHGASPEVARVLSANCAAALVPKPAP